MYSIGVKCSSPSLVFACRLRTGHCCFLSCTAKEVHENMVWEREKFHIRRKVLWHKRAQIQVGSPEFSSIFLLMCLDLCPQSQMKVFNFHTPTYVRSTRHM